MGERQDSNPLYDGIRSLVLSARQSAARGVDLLQVYTNYEIGRRIFEQEQQGADRALYGVAVGIRISPYPPHRSGLADFPHPAPTLGNDAHTAQRK
jgi:hypothetical protein